MRPEMWSDSSVEMSDDLEMRFGGPWWEQKPCQGGLESMAAVDVALQGFYLKEKGAAGRNWRAVGGVVRVVCFVCYF